MPENKIAVDVPTLTKQEVIHRIELMIANCKNKDTVVALKNIISYVKRIKE